MDEPTSGQDWHFRRSLGNLLSELRELGQAILLITHDLSFAEQHAHWWLLLAEGQVVAEGPPWQVMANETAMRRASLEPTEAFQLYA
jgi:energy-coupling factor transporter ATP-binding protein EcfA2